MQRNCCHISFAFILKFLNFLQAFIGVSIIIYSIWMLDQWNHHVPISPPSSSPPPAPSPASLYLFLNSRTAQPTWVSDHPLNFLVSATDDGLGFDLTSVKLPAPWFIYSFMGVGILLCCITLIGCIAAEAISGCCLCFYTLIKTVFILLEAALAAFIAIDRHWEKDLPYDPTGELDNLRSFIENNVDICKWAGITVIIIQALSLLLAIVLRAMASTRRTDLGDEDDYEIARGRREPLLNSQSNQTSGSTHSDIWSSRIREKAPFDEPYYPFTIGRSRGRKRNKDLLFEVDFPVHRPMTRSLTWSRNNLVLEPNTMGGSSKSDEMKAILQEIQATNEARVAKVESRMSTQMHQLTLQLDEVLARLNRNQGGESQVGTSSSNTYGKPPYRVENRTNQPPGSAVVPRYTKLE